MLRLEGLGQLKKSNDLIGIRTRDLPAWYHGASTNYATDIKKIVTAELTALL